jgi:hypothetical protein
MNSRRMSQSALRRFPAATRQLLAAMRRQDVAMGASQMDRESTIGVQSRRDDRSVNSFRPVGATNEAVALFSWAHAQPWARAHGYNMPSRWDFRRVTIIAPSRNAAPSSRNAATGCSHGREPMDRESTIGLQSRRDDRCVVSFRPVGATNRAVAPFS